MGIAVVVLLIFYAIFGFLQKDSWYHATAGRFLINCQWNQTEGYKDLGNRSYASRADSNLTNWDAEYYNVIRKEGYHDTSLPGEKRLVPFFPLFPAVWKASFLPVSAIGFLNYALFLLGLVILGSCLLNKLPNDRKVILLVACVLLPGSVVFQMPYSEAVTLFSFALAVWAWFRNRSVLFYLFLLLFSLGRPTSGILGLAFLSTALYFTILGKATLKLWLQTGLAVLVLLAGPLLYFAYHSTHYDNFWIFFEMQRHWGSYFRIPEAFTDWSFESLAMGMFGFFCVVLPFTIGGAVAFFRALRSRKEASLFHLFDGNTEEHRDFLAVLSLAFCLGLSLFTVFFQGGSLHSYSRYLLAGPFGLILLFRGGEWLCASRGWVRMLAIVVPAALGIWFWSTIAYHWRWDFRDAPFFIMLAMVGVWALYDQLPRAVSWSVGGLVGLMAILYQTHFYNSFLLDCWFFL